jgi:hypothetical protein
MDIPVHGDLGQKNGGKWRFILANSLNFRKKNPGAKSAPGLVLS